MKVAIGYHLTDSAWGGGNQFGKSLSSYLVQHNHQVTHTLESDDIDIILITDPRCRSSCVSFTAHNVLSYLLSRNQDAIVVHRINECDERKNTRYMNRRLRLCNYMADHTVSISKWLSTLRVTHNGANVSVIPNGADESIFFPDLNNTWQVGQKLRLVTHHWSPNIMKGFDVYSHIDNLLSEPEWAEILEFTYIGNLPPNFSFSNVHHIPPLNSFALADALRRSHIYITASQNEPAGMHHIEAALCGLPLLYRNSGALPEYCKDYGVSFDNDSYIQSLKLLILSYYKFRLEVLSYPFTSIMMCQSYLQLFKSLLINRESLLRNRNLFRSPLRLFLNALPIP